MGLYLFGIPIIENESEAAQRRRQINRRRAANDNLWEGLNDITEANPENVQARQQGQTDRTEARQGGRSDRTENLGETPFSNSLNAFTDGLLDPVLTLLFGGSGNNQAPTVLGLPVGTALLVAGAGTAIYIVSSQKK